MNYLQDKEFLRALTALKKEFNPTHIYLFGSRAKGTAHAKSDFDIVLIVEKSDLTNLERMQRAQTLFWDEKISVSIDAFIFTKEEFENSKDDFHTIPEMVTAESVELDLAAI